MWAFTMRIHVEAPCTSPLIEKRICTLCGNENRFGKLRNAPATVVEDCNFASEARGWPCIGSKIPEAGMNAFRWLQRLTTKSSKPVY
jgi:hypothetical protein